MKTYNVWFTGRIKGAIGLHYQIKTTVQGEDKKQALLNLYDKYEHISSPVMEEIKEETK